MLGSTKNGLRILLYVMVMVSCVSASGDVYDRSHPLGLDYWHPYGRFSMDFETPHIKWAKPLAGGQIKAMVLAPEWTYREVVELAQRLDVKITPWMCYSTEELSTSHGDPAFSAYIVSQPLTCRLLDEYLQESFDVYIVGKVNWDILPAKNRFELLEKVSQGAGLVLVCPPEHEELNIVLSKHPTDDAGRILNGLPWQVLPRLKGADESKLVRTATFGKGRVVKLDYQQPFVKPKATRIDQSMHSLTPDWVMARPNGPWKATDDPAQEVVPYEYYQSLVARAVCWAAGRGKKGSVKVEIPKDIQTQKKAKAQLDITPAGAVVHTAIRDEFGTVVAEPVFAKGSITIPPLPSGDYMLNVWLRDKEGAVIDWGSWAFSISSESAIKDISLTTNMFNIGDRVKGSIITEGFAESLKVELWDLWNRKIDEKKITVTANKATFDLGPLQPVTVLHYIRAELINSDKVVAKKQIEFPVRMKHDYADFTSLIWCASDNTYPTWAMLRKLYEDGADTTYTLPGEAWVNYMRSPDTIPAKVVMNVLARNSVRAGLLISLYNSGFGLLGAPKDTHIVSSDRNMISEQMVSKHKEGFLVDSSVYGPYGPFLWSHGDESLYSHDPDVDWGEDALKRFRQEAKHMYDSNLEDLNKEWKTAYATWEEVMPLDFEDAKDSNNYAPWVVHRLASDAIWAEFYETVGDSLRVNDPGAKTGYEGSLSLNQPNLGSDLWRLPKHVQILQAYHGESLPMEIYRCFAPANAVRGMWYGTYGPTWSIGPSTIEYCHYHPWYSLFHSLNSSWFWTNGSPGPLSGHAQDMTSLPFFEARTRAVRQIKSGIGKLLLASKRQNDKIAIHFSESSKMVECFYQKTTNSWCDGWVDSILSVARMLEDAGLQYEFVSYEQVENDNLAKDGFKAFFMPHSRAISKKEAEQIVLFAKNGGVVLADIMPAVHNEKGTLFEESLLKALFAEGGKGVLYGEDWNDYGGIHKSTTQDWRELKGRWGEMAKLMAEKAGIKPAVQVTGQDIPPVEITRFDADGVELVGLIRSYFLYDNGEYSAAIDFGREGYIYDVRQGKLLGQMSAMPVKLDYQAQLFAVSPYRVDGLGVTTNGDTVDITLKTSGEVAPARHVFHLSVFGPDGKELRWYSQNILAANGKAKTDIPFSSNDKGQFTIEIRDVISGVTTQVKVKR